MAIEVCRFTCGFYFRPQILHRNNWDTTISFLSVACSCIFLVLVEGFVESEYEVTKVQDIESHFHWLEG